MLEIMEQDVKDVKDDLEHLLRDVRVNLTLFDKLKLIEAN